MSSIMFRESRPLQQYCTVRNLRLCGLCPVLQQYTPLFHQDSRDLLPLLLKTSRSWTVSLGLTSPQPVQGFGTAVSIFPCRIFELSFSTKPCMFFCSLPLPRRHFFTRPMEPSSPCKAPRSVLATTSTSSRCPRKETQSQW